MAGTLHLGTSGFAYPEWKGTFYPPKIRQKDMLAFYAERFDSVEINYTFRKEPTEEVLASWAEATPEDFLFTLKAHQRVTHWLRLSGAAEATATFLQDARLLGPKLGAVLFQCPPNLLFDLELITAFLDILPTGIRYAFEFRHPSWTAARDMLTAHRAAWCVADTDEHPAPLDPLTAEPFSYLRLRKLEYPDQELRAWAARIADVLAKGSDVFCYFKHEDKAAGPRFAARLRELMGSSKEGGADVTLDGSGRGHDGAPRSARKRAPRT
jgi:uncharacterized protein YecE (DUF72 family)